MLLRAAVIKVGVSGVLALLLAHTPRAAHAGIFEDVLRSQIVGTRPIQDGRGIVALKAPYRPEDIRAVPFEIEARLQDGRSLKRVSFVVDNNPTPIAAAFTLSPGRDHVALAIRFRLNQQSDIRAIVEADDGQVYMVSQLMKFPGGQAACSAPPATPPEIARANMGKMTLTELSAPGAASAVSPRMRLELSHPNHTGMVLDQITLLFTPLRMVNEIVIRQGDEHVFTMEGSIALNENPVIDFDIKRNGASQLTVSASDTDGARFERTFQFGTGS